MKTHVKRIMVIGGGAGGLELATRLGRTLGKRKKAHIVLIDAELTHIWKPLLHEVAAGTLNSYEDELNYFAHAAKNHFEFRLGRMIGLDRRKKLVKLAALRDWEGAELAPDREETYDVLVFWLSVQRQTISAPRGLANTVFFWIHAWRPNVSIHDYSPFICVPTMQPAIIKNLILRSSGQGPRVSSCPQN